ncbi:MAG: lysozyme inhibitor LprI family protein [Pseudomonadota bacterium]
MTRRRRLIRVLAAVTAMLPLPLLAQSATPDCAADTLDADEVEECVLIAQDLVEAELDELYRIALVRAAAWDEEAALTGETAFAPLRDLMAQSQADWTAHAESTCAVEGLLAGDDTPVSVRLCYIRLAERRIEDLREFGASD